MFGSWLDEKKCLLEVQIVFPIVWLNTFCMANTYELYAHFQTISKTIELPQTVWEFSPYSLISFLGVNASNSLSLSHTHTHSHTQFHTHTHARAHTHTRQSHIHHRHTRSIESESIQWETREGGSAPTPESPCLQYTCMCLVLHVSGWHTHRPPHSCISFYLILSAHHAMPLR